LRCRGLSWDKVCEGTSLPMDRDISGACRGGKGFPGETLEMGTEVWGETAGPEPCCGEWYACC